MSCTIYYRGILKEKTRADEILCAISNHAQDIAVKTSLSENSVIITFAQRQCESIVIPFSSKKVNGSCKYIGNNQEGLYKIFDLFRELKPLFSSLSIEDDFGIWNDYITQKQLCKITLKSLSKTETKFLTRIIMNENKPPDELECFLMEKSRLRPFNKKLLRAILQDFIRIYNISNVEYFQSQTAFKFETVREPKIVNGVAILELVEKTYLSRDFPYKLVQIWLSNAFEYKNMGMIKDVKDNARGLKTSMEAAKSGITSIFFNRHAGGAVNSKEAEMKKFAKKYYETGSLGEVMVIDIPERELMFLFSMMDYLGFHYVGVE